MLNYRQVHLDFHTSEHIPNIAERFDARLFAKQVKEAHIDSITCFGRCHHGWLYYPSKAQPEMIHPHLKNERLLLDQIEACHAEGIKVPVYTTVQWDGYVAKHHPEWLCRDEKGEPINSQGVPEPHFYYTLCLNSDYRTYFKEHLVDMIESVTPDKLDGVFMDILFRTDCQCEHCQKEMKKHGYDVTNKSDRLAYSDEMLRIFKAEISELIRQKAPKASIFYNGSHVGFADKHHLEAYSHLELESLPSGGWGYDHFPITMRYARNLGKPVIGMTGKFHTYWGDFHSYKNLPALQFECFNMLALGAGCSIGDQLHPDGALSPASYELIGKVYEEVAGIEKWCRQANQAQVEIGVLTPEETWRPGSHSLRISPSIIGVNRLLQELNYQFDIIDSEMSFDRYRVLILPDIVEVTPLLVEKLANFTSRGGAVIGSFKSLVENQAGAEFFGIEFEGLSPYHRDFILPNDRYGRELPQEPHVMYLQGASVKTTKAETLMATVKSYFNREGETFCSHQHAPAQNELGSPALTRYQNQVYFSHPIFESYRHNAPRWIKVLLAEQLAELLPDKLLTHDGPSTLLTTVNQSEDSQLALIHCLHYITQKNTETIYTIDEVIPLHDIHLTYQIGSRSVKRVTNALTGETIFAKEEAGKLLLDINRIDGHLVIAVEFE